MIAGLCINSQASIMDVVSAWIGYQPSDKLYVKMHKSLFEMEDFKSRLNSILPIAERPKLLKEYNLESRIEKQGSYYVFTRCKPHFCHTNIFVVFIDSANSDLTIYAREIKGGENKSAWYGSPTKMIAVPREMIEITKEY